MRFIFFVLMAAVSSTNHLQDMNDNFETMMKQLDPKVERPDTKEGHERIEVALDRAFSILENMAKIADSTLPHVRGCTPPCCTEPHSAEELRKIYLAEIQAKQSPRAHSMALVYIDAKDDSVKKGAVKLFLHDQIGADVAAFPLIDEDSLVKGSIEFRELTCDQHNHPRTLTEGEYAKAYSAAFQHINAMQLVEDIVIGARQRGWTFSRSIEDSTFPSSFETKLKVMQNDLGKMAYRMIVVWVFTPSSFAEMDRNHPKYGERIWSMLHYLDDFYLISNWVGRDEHPRLLAKSEHSNTKCKTAEVQNILNQITADEQDFGAEIKALKESVYFIEHLNTHLPMCNMPVIAAVAFQNGRTNHQFAIDSIDGRTTTTIKSSIRTDNKHVAPKRAAKHVHFA